MSPVNQSRPFAFDESLKLDRRGFFSGATLAVGVLSAPLIDDPKSNYDVYKERSDGWWKVDWDSLVKGDTVIAINKEGPLLIRRWVVVEVDESTKAKVGWNGYWVDQEVVSLSEIVKLSWTN